MLRFENFPTIKKRFTIFFEGERRSVCLPTQNFPIFLAYQVSRMWFPLQIFSQIGSKNISKEIGIQQ